MHIWVYDSVWCSLKADPTPGSLMTGTHRKPWEFGLEGPVRTWRVLC